MSELPATKERYARWWYDDLPPMNGLLRFFFYSGLLALALVHEQSPLRAIELYEDLDPSLFDAYGVMGLIGMPYVSPEIAQGVMWVTIIAWGLTAIGLLTRVSSVVTAVGVTFLHGLFQGVTALSSAWTLPVYCLLLLTLASYADRWSADAFCIWVKGKLFPKKEYSPELYNEFDDFATDLLGSAKELDYAAAQIRDSTEQQVKEARKLLALRKMAEGDQSDLGAISTSGFIRKCVLILAVSCFFAAGLGKLGTAGPQWMDGRTLQYHLSDKDGWVADALDEYQSACVLFSVIIMLVQLGGVSALFTSTTRPLLLAAWFASGFFSYFALEQWDWASTWCLMLLVEWRQVAWKISGYARLGWRMWTVQHAEEVLEYLTMRLRWQFIQRYEVRTGAATRTCLPGGFRSRRQEVAMVIGTAAMLVLLVVAVFQIRWWPLACFDLHSSYSAGESGDEDAVREGYLRDRYRSAEKAQLLAIEVRGSRHARHVAGYMASLCELRVASRVRSPRRITDSVIPTRDQWIECVVAPMILDELAAKPEGEPGVDPDYTEYPSDLLLRRLLPVIRRQYTDYKDYERVELLYGPRRDRVILAWTLLDEED